MQQIRGSRSLALIGSLAALLAWPAPARAGAAQQGPAPDPLYWIAPRVAEALPGGARERLARLAPEVVAGALPRREIDAAVARALEGADDGLRDYLSWELRFVGGAFDLDPQSLREMAAHACCATSQAYFALQIAQRARAAGADAAALVAGLAPEASSAAAAVLALADLDRGRPAAARARLDAVQAGCVGDCAPTGHLLLARAAVAFFDAKFDAASALAGESLARFAAETPQQWLASLPSLADLALLFTELKQGHSTAETLALAGGRADALLPRDHHYALALAVAGLGAAIEEYESAVAAGQHATLVARFGAAPPPEALATIELRIDEGALAWLRSDYAAASERADAAIADIERTLGASAPKLADALVVRALACNGLGDHECAVAALRRAIALRESLYTFPHPLVAEAQNNLAVNLHDRGRYDLAEPLMQSVLAIDRAYYAADNEEIASDLHNLASLYRAMGDPPQAIELLQQALAIDERVLGPRHARTGYIVHGLGQAYLEAGDWARAFDSFRRAVDIQTEVDPESRSVPVAKHNLAAAALELGQPALARELLEQALARYAQPSGADWRKIATAHRDLARAFAALGDAEAAARALLRAADLAPFADAPEVHWRTFMAIAREDEQRGNPRSAVFFGKLALDVLQRLRATQSTLARPLQADFLRHRAGGYRRVVAWLVDLGRLSEAHTVRSMLAQEEYYDYTVRQAFVGLREVPFTPFERERRARLQAAWDAAGGKQDEPSGYGAAVASAREAFATLAEAAARAEPAEIAHAPPAAGVAYVDYVVTEERVDAIVHTPAGRYAARSDVARGELRRLVFEWRETLDSPRRDPRPHAQALYAHLIAPVAERLRAEGIERLWITPDDVLRYVPFTALHDGARYLGERYAIARVSPLGADGRAAAPTRVAAFAVSRAVGGYDALPGTETEVDAIVRSDARDASGELPGRVWLNDAFDRAGLRGALGDGYSIVHVASHFRFAPGDDADSFLLLGTGERLALRELRTGDYPLDHVDLLTMSGCDTAAESEDADGREIDGFAAIAASKGARHVLATLWSIEDEATTALMRAFYAGIARGLDPAAALGAAREPFYERHPFYWAAFALWGTPAGAGAR